MMMIIIIIIIISIPVLYFYVLIRELDETIFTVSVIGQIKSHRKQYTHLGQIYIYIYIYI
jgi:hypothetical protein